MWKQNLPKNSRGNVRPALRVGEEVDARAPITVAPEVARATMTEVLKFNYLGSTNKKINETGNLSVFYRYLAIGVHKKSFARASSQEVINDFEIFVQAASIFSIGAGNCGELTAALKAKLWSLPELSAEQKLLVEAYSYPAKDAHQENSYVKIGTMVYDIWAEEEMKEDKMYKRSGVPKRKHTLDFDCKKFANHTAEEISELLKFATENFSKNFEVELKQARRQGTFYPTFDSTDKGEFAIHAIPAFTYLAKKFFETFNDPYFISHPAVATLIRNKIVNDFVLLIEELRQDYPMAGVHSHRKKYSDTEIQAVLNQCVSNSVLVNYLLVISYRNFHPKRFVEAVKDFGLPEKKPTSKSVEEWVLEQVSECHKPAKGPESALPVLIDRGQHPVFQRESSQEKLNQNNSASKVKEIKTFSTPN